MNAFCHIFNEIKKLKGKAEGIEKYNIKTLKNTKKEIDLMFKILNTNSNTNR